MGFIKVDNINCRVFKVTPVDHLNEVTKIREYKYPYDEFYAHIKDMASENWEAREKVLRIAKEFLKIEEECMLNPYTAIAKDFNGRARVEIELVGYSDDKEDCIKDYEGSVICVDRDEKEE